MGASPVVTVQQHQSVVLLQSRRVSRWAIQRAQHYGRAAHLLMLAGDEDACDAHELQDRPRHALRVGVRIE